MQRMIDRKLKFFGHIMPDADDRLIKQVVFSIIHRWQEQER